MSKKNSHELEILNERRLALKEKLEAFLNEKNRIKMETLKQRRLNYEKIKTAKDCTEKKEIINSKKYETLLKERSTLV